MNQSTKKKNGLSLFASKLAVYSDTNNMAHPVDDVGWLYPRNFYITLNTRRFEESTGMTTSKYCVISSKYLRKNQEGLNTLSLTIGADQLPALAKPGSMPDWCEAPVGSHDYLSNLGSAGKALSIWFDRSRMYLRKTWEFRYCTNTM